MKDIRLTLLLAVTVLCLGAASVARADTIAFTGSRTALNNPPPVLNVGRCGGAPNLLVTPSPGTGTSNFGAFTTQESFCTNPTTGIVSNGLFTYNFANGSTLFGTISGSSSPFVNNIQLVSFIFSITGGTGLFAGATGSLLADGQVTILPSGFTNSTLNFNGTITTVPEPATLVLLGTGLAGVATKVRKRLKAISTSTTA
ncbi:MAG: PEP-CTERM sorting domain-containing protein [Pyrinomonadaceae bacterium]